MLGSKFGFLDPSSVVFEPGWSGRQGSALGSTAHILGLRIRHVRFRWASNLITLCRIGERSWTIRARKNTVACVVEAWVICFGTSNNIMACSSKKPCVCCVQILGQIFKQPDSETHTIRHPAKKWPHFWKFDCSYDVALWDHQIRNGVVLVYSDANWHAKNVFFLPLVSPKRNFPSISVFAIFFYGDVQVWISDKLMQ